MAIELTDADRAEIALCCVSSLNFVERAIAERAYRAGLAAGVKRSAQRCEGLTQPGWKTGERAAVIACVIAILNLVALD
jgi:hypothetical protein